MYCCHQVDNIKKTHTLSSNFEYFAVWDTKSSDGGIFLWASLAS